ncbi:MAG: hypothetical protein HZA01_10255 [Nitrospinae bacterium]|nr:hypothetical protein [Nitrospinota bacterium]
MTLYVLQEIEVQGQDEDGGDHIEPDQRQVDVHDGKPDALGGYQQLGVRGGKDHQKHIRDQADIDGEEMAVLLLGVLGQGGDFILVDLFLFRHLFFECHMVFHRRVPPLRRGLFFRSFQ